MPNKRYTCPTCGTGILAPSRLRKIDVRRYCLPCSEEAGVLVERTCPSREREREEKAAAKRDAAKRARAAEAEKVKPKKRIEALMRKMKKLRTYTDEGLRWDRGRVYLDVAPIHLKDTHGMGQVQREAYVLNMVNLAAVQEMGQAKFTWGQPQRAVSHASTYLAAACEWFKLDEKEVLQQLRVQLRLAGKPLAQGWLEREAGVPAIQKVVITLAKHGRKS